MLKHVSLRLVIIFGLLLAACTPAGTATVVPTTAPTTAAPVATEAPTTAVPTVAATSAPAGGATTAPNASGSGDPTAVCSADPLGCAKIPAGQTVKIGMGAPMTGDYAAFGQDISQGAKLAVSDAGAFKGFSFELDAQDDQGSAEGGAAVANKLVSDPTVVAIAGHIFSGATQAAIPIYEKAGIPMMSPSATNPDLTKKGSKVFNRLVFTDAIQGKFAAEYLFKKLNVKQLAILHDGSDYGQGLANVVKTEFTTLGGTVVSFSAITPGESDYSAALADVAAKNPQALYYAGYAAEASVIANQKKNAGLGNAVLFSDDGTYGKDFLTRSGANGEGTYSTSPVPIATPTVTKFNEAYQAKYGVAPGVLSPYSWTAYDSAAVLIKDIEQVALVGSDGTLYIPRTALINAVRNTKDYQGLSGVVTCDQNGECASSGPTFYIDKAGAWVPASM